MPFRKDHLQLVTDAGATLDIGWAYGTPYSLDPINGVDVDVQTAQGVNQVGVSVECQSVAGVSRELGYPLPQLPRRCGCGITAGKAALFHQRHNVSCG